MSLSRRQSCQQSVHFQDSGEGDSPAMWSRPNLMDPVIDMIFVNCNWVVTQWQYTFTLKQCIERYKTNNA